MAQQPPNQSLRDRGETMADNRELGTILKLRRLMIPLTLKELAAKSGVSQSHLGRIEGGSRFPSAHILRKVAKPLGLGESELFSIAGYLPREPSAEVETLTGRLDPYVASVLASEPVAVQRAVIAILSIFKGIARGSDCDTEFREYAHRKYPELDDDIITMIEDLIELQRQEKRGDADRK